MHYDVEIWLTIVRVGGECYNRCMDKHNGQCYTVAVTTAWHGALLDRLIYPVRSIEYPYGVPVTANWQCFGHNN